MFKTGLGFALGALSFLYAGLASAATFETWCTPNVANLSGGCSVIMKGQIVKGDRERLIAALRTPVPAPGFLKTLVLDSPGGDVQEAFNLSDVVVRAVLDTTTVDYSKPMQHAQNSCVSACFLVWVAGADRFQASFKKAGLGLHRPYFSAETYNQQDASTVAQRQQEVSLKVRAYLRRFEVPDALIDTMMSRSSKDVYWVSAGDDPFVMSGRAPWFEELMIARCKFDPVFDADSQAAGVQETFKNGAENSARRKKYLDWRQSYNSCEYAFRQASLQKLLNP